MNSQRIKLLFVCMGNICRSPAAQGVIEKMVEDAGMQDRVELDSAGTISMHAGELPDPRMRQAASRRGYPLTHRARQVDRSDIDAFDLILVMDLENFADVESLANPQKHKGKLRLFSEFCTKHDDTEVPDPYHGGSAGFEKVLDMLEDGCAEILLRLKEGTLLQHPSPKS
jgi:protein-tyrosine phosphatase